MKKILVGLIMLFVASVCFAETDYVAMKEIKKIKDGTSATPIMVLKVSSNAQVNIINEYDTDTGVTVEGVLIKDGHITGGAGDTNSADTIIGTNKVVTDTINEYTAGAGVTIDSSSTIKDGTNTALTMYGSGDVIVGATSNRVVRGPGNNVLLQVGYATNGQVVAFSQIYSAEPFVFCTPYGNPFSVTNVPVSVNPTNFTLMADPGMTSYWQAVGSP